MKFSFKNKMKFEETESKHIESEAGDELLKREQTITEIESKHKSFIRDALSTMIVFNREDESVYVLERVPSHLCPPTADDDGCNRWYKRRMTRQWERLKRVEDGRNSSRRRRRSSALNNAPPTNYRRLLTLSMFIIFFVYQFNIHVLNKSSF